jgi:hypothetical protein
MLLNYDSKLPNAHRNFLCGKWEIDKYFLNNKNIMFMGIGNMNFVKTFISLHGYSVFFASYTILL